MLVVHMIYLVFYPLSIETTKSFQFFVNVKLYLFGVNNLALVQQQNKKDCILTQGDFRCQVIHLDVL